MRPEDQYPVLLEAPLKWEHLDEAGQKLFIQGLQSHNLDAFIHSCTVEIPTVFIITFPLHLVQPNHPPEAQGQVRVLVAPNI
jgi:hypothetical protein